MNRKAVIIPAVVVFVLLFGVSGRLEYEDAVAEEALYCDNVKSGIWPDYDGTYVSECEKEHGPKKVEKISF